MESHKADSRRAAVVQAKAANDKPVIRPNALRQLSNSLVYACRLELSNYFGLQTVVANALLNVNLAWSFQAFAASSQVSLLVNSAVTMLAGIERLRTSVRIKMYIVVLR